MLHYVEVSGVPRGALAAGIAALSCRVLPGSRPPDLAGRLTHSADAWGVVALDGETVVGFKLGYCDRPGRFYSWLGGVSPEHRRQGIARELMRRQHDRCQQQGYARIRTTTTNRFRPMLLLNISEGFDVIGTTANPDGHLRIVLEKAL